MDSAPADLPMDPDTSSSSEDLTEDDLPF